MYGGIEAFMIAIANAAVTWPEFDVKVCYKLVSKKNETEHLKTMTNLPSDAVYFVHKGSKELMKLVRWADVIHAQNMPPDVVFPAFLLKKKIYLTVHNRKRKSSFRSLRQFIWCIMIRLADKRWYNSNYVWNTWEPGRKRRNSACVPTVCQLSQGCVPIQKRQGFIFIGRWIKNKGIEEIIKAYARLKVDSNHWPLTIVGDGPIRQKVFDLIEKHGLSTKIQLPGFLSDRDKNILLAKTKWLIAPANTKEDLGLTPIEARSVGVPAIVSNDGGLPEAGGPSALLVEPGNVDDLYNKMRRAIHMSEDVYLQHSSLAKESLKSFVKPLNFYRQEYLQNVRYHDNATAN